MLTVYVTAFLLEFSSTLNLSSSPLVWQFLLFQTVYIHSKADKLSYTHVDVVGIVDHTNPVVMLLPFCCMPFNVCSCKAFCKYMIQRICKKCRAALSAWSWYAPFTRL